MRLLLAAGRILLNIVYFVHRLFPVKNRISFISRQANIPSEDFLMLEEELKRQSADTEVVISCKTLDEGLIGKIKYLMYMVTTQMHLFATSKVVVLDGYCIATSMLNHRKELKIVQAWHALGAFKKFGYCVLGEEEGYSREFAEAMHMHRNYTVVFVSSEECKGLLAPAYDCDPAIMKVMPLPRVDALHNEDALAKTRSEIYEKYPEIKDKGVILYAPTFRKNTDISGYINDLVACVDYTRYSLIIKTHPLDEISGDQESNAIYDFDFTSREMLSVADYVITDYSAFVFEAAVAGKPLFRYVPDVSSYDEKRGFLIDVSVEIPAVSSTDAREIIKAIEQQKYNLDEVKVFADKYVKAGRNNTEQMARYILELKGN